MQKKKISAKIMSFLLTFVMIMTMVSATVFAGTNDNHAGKVRIVVKNDTYKSENGAPWTGTLIDTWVDIDSESTVISMLGQAALQTLGSKDKIDIQDGSWGTYINGINELSSGMGNSWAGWMMLKNDSVTPNGISFYSVAQGNVEAGDEFSFEYSLNGGSDIGADYSDINNVKLDSVDFAGAACSPAFSSDKKEYVLTAGKNSDSMMIMPHADNRNRVVKVTADGNEYKRNDAIPVKDNSKVVITVSTSDGTDKSEYVFNVVKQNTISNEDFYNGMLSIINNDLNNATCEYGDEWAVLSAARAGILSEQNKNSYYDSIKNVLNENKSVNIDDKYPATTNARVTLALTAIGKNAASVDGYNLLEPFSDTSVLDKQGINAYIYALIAFDSNKYDIPQIENKDNQVTRQLLVDKILAAQTSANGWDWYGQGADPDMTSMAVQALAPYYSSSENVKSAVDKAVTALSDMQNPNGSYSSWGSESAYSMAQVITALSAVKINPDNDVRFVKNGYSVVDALKNFYIAGKGIKTAYGNNTIDPYAGVQSAYSLVAFERFTNNKNSLYDMTDAFEVKKPENGNTGDTGNDEIKPENPTAGSGTADDSSIKNDSTSSNETAGAESPKTADASDYICWLTLMMLSVAMAGSSCVIRRRIEK